MLFVRFVVLSFVLLACDHRPAPPRQQASQVTSDAMAGLLAIDDPCLKIGEKVAEIIIASTTDPTQKAAYEQDRTKLVKRFSENCNKEKWPDSARVCFLAAKTPADVEACSRTLPRPEPRQPAGSAVPDLPPDGSAAPIKRG